MAILFLFLAVVFFGFSMVVLWWFPLPGAQPAGGAEQPLSIKVPAGTKLSAGQKITIAVVFSPVEPAENLKILPKRAHDGFPPRF